MDAHSISKQQCTLDDLQHKQTTPLSLLCTPTCDFCFNLPRHVKVLLIEFATVAVQMQWVKHQEAFCRLQDQLFTDKLKLMHGNDMATVSLT